MMIRSTSLYLMCLTMMICMDLASLSSFAVIPPEHTHADRHTHNFSSIHRESSFVINWNNNKIARYNSFSSHCFVGVVAACCCSCSIYFDPSSINSTLRVFSLFMESHQIYCNHLKSNRKLNIKTFRQQFNIYQIHTRIAQNTHTDTHTYIYSYSFSSSSSSITLTQYDIRCFCFRKIYNNHNNNIHLATSSLLWLVKAPWKHSSDVMCTIKTFYMINIHKRSAHWYATCCSVGLLITLRKK